jgi:hypothetical protein
LIAINRLNSRVFWVKGASAALFRLMHAQNLPLADIQAIGPAFYERLVGPSQAAP